MCGIWGDSSIPSRAAKRAYGTIGGYRDTGIGIGINKGANTT
jgi:hypothetical protein